MGTDGVPMPKVLSPAIHAVLDYLLALAFLFAPFVLGFGGDVESISYIVGVIYLGLSLLTRYPLGAVALIPFVVHGVVETVLAVFWIAAPWLLGFADYEAPRNFFVVAGVFLLAVVALTRYREERRRRLVDRRQRARAVRPDRRTGPPDRRHYAAHGMG